MPKLVSGVILGFLQDCVLISDSFLCTPQVVLKQGKR